MSILQDFKEIKSTKKELREFGLLVGAVLALIGGWIWWKRGESPAVYALLVSGGGLMLFGAVFPAALQPLQKIWMMLAVCMGFVMTRVLLTVLYYLVITPIGLILKATGKDVLDSRGAGKGDTHWKDHSPYDPQGPYRQF